VSIAAVQVVVSLALIIAALALVVVVTLLMGLIFVYFFKYFSQNLCVYIYGLGFSIGSRHRV